MFYLIIKIIAFKLLPIYKEKQNKNERDWESRYKIL